MKKLLLILILSISLISCSNDVTESTTIYSNDTDCVFFGDGRANSKYYKNTRNMHMNVIKELESLKDNDKVYVTYRYELGTITIINIEKIK